MKVALSSPAQFFIYQSSESIATLPSGTTIVTPGEIVDIYLNSHFSGMLNMAYRDGAEPDANGMIMSRANNYRVSDKQITALRKQFNVDGIPYYILVNRQGKATGRPDLRAHNAFKKAILDEMGR